MNVYFCLVLILGGGILMFYYQQFQLPKIIQRERVRTRRVCVRCLYEDGAKVPFDLQKYNATAEENEKILEEQ